MSQHPNLLLWLKPPLVACKHWQKWSKILKSDSMLLIALFCIYRAKQLVIL